MIAMRLFIAVFLYAAALAGCGPSQTSTGKPGPRIEIHRLGGSSTPTAHDSLIEATIDSVNATWVREFAKRRCCFDLVGAVVVDAPIDTPCGHLTANKTPMFCGASDKIYIMDDNWTERSTAMGHYSRAAEYLMVAHEIGHAVQWQTGTLRRMLIRKRRAAPAEVARLNIENELQADCYAGIWFADHHSELSASDIADLGKGSAVAGDDYITMLGKRFDAVLQHGTGADRLAWFNRGLASGDPEVCEIPDNPGV